MGRFAPVRDSPIGVVALILTGGKNQHVRPRRHGDEGKDGRFSEVTGPFEGGETNPRP
jgi:hypothetical protein